MTHAAPHPDDWDQHWTTFQEWTKANPAQEYRRRLIRAHLDLRNAAGARVLDIGSGIGDMLAEIDAEFPDVPKLGLELSRSGVEISQRRIPNAAFLQRDLISGTEDAGAYRGYATHAICSEVLEHVDDPVRLISRARDYMADGCRLVVTVPGGPITAYDHHIGHRRHFTPAEIADLLTRAGYHVLQSTGAGYPMFNLYRLLLMWRGEKLVAETHRPPTRLARMAIGTFALLFHLNSSTSRFGWQTIAVATCAQRSASEFTALRPASSGRNQPHPQHD